MSMRPVVLGVVLLVTHATLASAQTGQTPPAQTQSTQTPPDQTKVPTIKETVVVSASKTEQQLVDAPATMTVIGARALSLAPSNNYGDLLRSVPGVNVTQISARDINITSRAATSSLATSQLAVLDGRSLYQDFFGFIMWDFMPVNLNEIKRIEVIRGPASAVWGANALSGVINVITKSPREMAGTSFVAGAGAFGRDVGTTKASSGSLFYVSGTHAQAVNDRVAYKISAGTYSSDALARPTGLVPNATKTPYPSYANTGTSQPKFDARVDYEFPDGVRKIQVSGGLAGTDGIMHSGIGPFDIQSGTKLGYAKFVFAEKAFRFQAFTNVLDGDAKNLLTADQAGNQIDFRFNTKTTDFEMGNTRVIGARQAITYGGNLRLNKFHLTIAPGETSRTEGGAYIQDEIVFNNRFRLVPGARVDKFSSIDKAVFSPRVAFLIKPKSDQTFRVSYNRAFRSPSMVNNNLDVTIATVLPLGAVNPAFGTSIFRVPTTATGNPKLTEEHIDAYELSYTGTIRDRITVSAAYYYTQFSDEIFFTQTDVWGRLDPPPGFPGLGPFPPAAIWAGVFDAGIHFPKAFTYRNLGKEKNQGIELGLDANVTPSVGLFANYSHQADPKPVFPNFTTDQALAEINHPANNRFNMGISCDTPHGFGSVSISHAGQAFWQDVLDDRFHGETKPFTFVNLTVGAKFDDGRYTLSFKAVNLGNQQIMQHVFGDVIRRQLVGEFKVQLPR